MAASDSKSLPSLGFLTVVQRTDGSLVGGYLVLSPIARPLEFHCTSPVEANRAQQILYGRTLRPYLCGEQIGRALVDRAQHRPLFVCTDDPDILPLRGDQSPPVVCVLGPADPDTATDGMPHHPSTAVTIGAEFQWGPYRAWVHPQHTADQTTLQTHWQQHLVDFDLCEPFERIRQAIQETQAG